MTNSALDGNPHVRIDEGDGVSAKPRRSPLLYNNRTLSAILACLVVGGASAATLTVPSGTTETRTTDGVFTAATIEGSLTISSGVTLVPGPVTLGEGAVVTATDAGRFVVTGSTAAVTIGASGGCAKFVVSDQTKTQDAKSEGAAGFWLNRLTIPQSATPPAGADTLDVFALGPGGVAVLNTTAINNTTTPTRFLFRGGQLWKHYRANSAFATCAAGATAIFEGTEEFPITLAATYCKPILLSGAGTLVTTGACDVVFTGLGERDAVPAPSTQLPDAEPSTGATNNPNLPWLRVMGDVRWGHSGNLRVQKNGWLRLGQTDGLPHGPQTGIVCLEQKPSGTAPGARLDMNGYSSRLNGLVSVGQVTNFANAVTSTLTFGSHDDDGVLAAKITGNIDVVKEGTGTLVVSNTVIPRVFDIRRGTVLVKKGDNALGALQLGVGAVLVIDGVAARCESLGNLGGTVEYRNGGSLRVFKSGNVEMLMQTKEVSSVPIHVAAGRLTFVGDACTNAYWRLTVRKSQISTGFGEFALFSSTNKLPINAYPNDDSPQNKGLLPQDEKTLVDIASTGFTNFVYRTSTDARNLEKGRFSFTANSMWSEGKNGRVWCDSSTLFDGVLGAWVFESKETAPTPVNASSWLTWTFRLASDMPCVRTYSFFNNFWSRNTSPTSWLLETSANGVDWVVADDRDGVAIPSFSSGNYEWYNNGEPFVLKVGPWSGAKGTVPETPIQVDADSVLDCSLMENRQNLSNLVLDWEFGGGTFVNVALTETGTLDLRNVPSAASLTNYVLPYQFENSITAGSLAQWQVRVNGETSALKLSWNSEGRLWLPARGTLVRFR